MFTLKSNALLCQIIDLFFALLRGFRNRFLEYLEKGGKGKRER
ncbi:hypothetical protein DSOL_3747 [Desulfosporosinus metallidurans]|uniref:Uncharacterized protein n=1 Tax=Desulfosporosinus metallidurans TaxID=1888891 RepID=A0A1Q8QP36_9FIRM|nr:hypothetical protein DSOL_3747 [Desulfosporosinus metallidurans]